MIKLKPNELKAVTAFKAKCCERSKRIDSDEEYDWYALSLGFFLALDIEPKRAHALARHVRYTEHYWME